MGFSRTLGARFGLASRTAALLIVLLAAISVAGSAWFVRHHEQGQRARYEERVRVLSSTLHRSVTTAMLHEHRDRIPPLLEVVASAGGVAGLAVADAEGRIRYHFGDVPERLDFVDHQAASQPIWTADRLTMTRPIAATAECRSCHADSAQVRGALMVSLDTSALEPQLRRASAFMTAIVVCGILFASLVLLVVLKRMVSRPIQRLQRFAERLGSGDLEAPAPDVPGPEAAALAGALASMAARVKDSRDELEGRVDQRTAALTQALGTANQAREERTEALQRLQVIIDSMVDGVIFVDAEDRIALTNRSARVLRGLSEEPGRLLTECHPEHSLAMLQRVLEYLRNGDDTGPPHPIIKEAQGRFETTYSPVRSQAGAYLGTAMVIRDISERRTLERRLLDAERLAAVGQMSAQVAHELRNPLNAIGGAVQYIRRVLPAHDAVAEFTELIDDEVERVNLFIRDLLCVARPAEPAFVTSFVADVVEEARRHVAMARGLEGDAIRMEVESNLAPLSIDPRMIVEAVVNLLDNALDAGGDEPPVLAARYEADNTAGTVVVEVSDRGCGISDDRLDDVVRPFVTSKAAGTGLGLTIVARAMRQHRGRLDIRPREGGGTTVTLSFPVRTLSLAAPAPRMEAVQ